MVQPGSSTAAGQPASKLLEAAVVACVSSFGFYLLAKFVNNRWFLDTLLKELRKAHDDLEHEQEKRKSERAGRIRAEQELRKLQLQAATAQLLTAGAAASTADSADAAAASSPASTSDQAPAVYPFKPIGYIRSCFSQRCEQALYVCCCACAALPGSPVCHVPSAYKMLSLLSCRALLRPPSSHQETARRGSRCWWRRRAAS